MSTIKEKLPRNFIMKLKSRTKFTDSTISRVVNQEKVEHPIWPEVLKLAEEHQNQLAAIRTRTERLKKQNL